MFLFLKSLSRSVHEEHQEQPELSKTQGDLCTSLTVWRKSLIISCNGFTVIGSDGNLVYRVDNYMGRPKEIILMDGSGKSILTMHRSKVLSSLYNSRKISFTLIYVCINGRNMELNLLFSWTEP